MAPLCLCGHRASEHYKQMNIRTYCTQIDAALTDDDDPRDCECTLYRAKETK